MAPSAGEECGICLDALTNPVALPCRHKFCSKCLHSWRSKYGNAYDEHVGEATKTCPLCREKIPPSREMVRQLEEMRRRKLNYEAEGDTSSALYSATKLLLERLERQLGDDWTEAEVLDFATSDHECMMVLPNAIYEAARRSDVQTVLEWLGPPPVDKKRINATNPNFMSTTLIFYPAMTRNSDLLSILLQFGADVNALTLTGHCSLSIVTSDPAFHQQACLLLEWGADMDPSDPTARGELGNAKLANLLQSEFGGRRCELLDLSKRPDLNGKACVVEKYLPERDRYKIIVEGSMEAALVRPTNLKRRDRTPTDCGYYITFNKGKFSRREFASKEECQAYVAEVEAKGLAEQLARLGVGSSNAKGKSGKKGRKKKGKKGRK